MLALRRMARADEDAGAPARDATSARTEEAVTPTCFLQGAGHVLIAMAAGAAGGSVVGGLLWVWSLFCERLRWPGWVSIGLPIALGFLGLSFMVGQSICGGGK